MAQPGVSAPLFGQPRPAARAKARDLDESEGVLFAFETLDAERTGFVNRKQLKVALRALGFPVKKADVQELLTRHGEEATERLDFQTFRKVVSDQLAQRSPLDEHRRAFQLFDVLGTGQIDFPTLRRVVRSLHLDIPDEELQDMINEFGKNGLITEHEWLALMSND